MMDLGQRLSLAIKRRNVRKLYAIAVEIGVDESALSRWKKGGAISLPNAARLCLTLDISLDWLVLGRGEMDAHKQNPRSPFSDLSANEARHVQQALETLVQLAARSAQT
jgi:transcriptional regulator with XRE-family HTH domain